MSAVQPDPEKQWIVVGTDTGSGDAHSLLHLLAQDDVEILGITSISGNTEVDDAVRNIAAVLEVAGRHDIPTFLGAAGPIEASIA